MRIFAPTSAWGLVLLDFGSIQTYLACCDHHELHFGWPVCVSSSPSPILDSVGRRRMKIPQLFSCLVAPESQSLLDSHYVFALFGCPKDSEMLKCCIHRGFVWLHLSLSSAWKLQDISCKMDARIQAAISCHKKTEGRISLPSLPSLLEIQSNNKPTKLARLDWWFFTQSNEVGHDSGWTEEKTRDGGMEASKQTKAKEEKP